MQSTTPVPPTVLRANEFKPTKIRPQDLRATALNHMENILVRRKQKEQALAQLRQILNNLKTIRNEQGWKRILARPGFGTLVIALIGRLFFLGKLENVPLVIEDDPEKCKELNAIAETRFIFTDTVDEGVLLCTGGRDWRLEPMKEKWKFFFGTMLHEAIHVYYLRWSNLIADGACHDGIWHVMGEAVERHASEMFGFQVDIGRWDSWRLDCEDSDFVDITAEEMVTCFGYSKSLAKVVAEGLKSRKKEPRRRGAQKGKTSAARCKISIAFNRDME